LGASDEEKEKKCTRWCFIILLWGRDTVILRHMIGASRLTRRITYELEACQLYI